MRQIGNKVVVYSVKEGLQIAQRSVLVSGRTLVGQREVYRDTNLGQSSRLVSSSTLVG